MRKNILVPFAFVLGVCLCACSAGSDGGNSSTTTVLFKTDESLFANPERGLYTHRGYESTSSPITVNEFAKLRKENITLVFMSYHLKDFLNQPLSNSMLTLIQNNLDALRKGGMKAVLRFAYSKSSSAAEYDAPLDVTLNHINQLKPLFEKNMDVIAVLEAGFIGAWGEWYYSTHYGNMGNPDYDKRQAVLNALLSALPKERMISLRTPTFKVKLLDIGFGDALTEAEAYSQTSKARLSHHNDCFLADGSDMGTYKAAADREYTAADSRYTCMGGETCTSPTTFSECALALNAMSTYHWSYLNIDYHKDMLNDWAQKGCFNEILKRLGYRFVLVKAEHSEAAAGAVFELSLTLKNIGFAAPYNPRKAELVFRQTETGELIHRHEMQADPRFWFGGEETVVKELVMLPPNVPAGEYTVLLSLSDATESLRKRPEYAIRFANEGVWEEATGYNRLFSVTLSR